MVAKTFETNHEIITEPFEEKGKMYVMVRNTNTGTKRKVRWYTEKEYSKMYAAAVPTVSQESRPYKSQREALGFQKGYVTIFKGDTYTYLDWFRHSVARYCGWWGWYVVSTDELPNDIPEELTPITLPWHLVGDEDGYVFDDKALIKANIESLTYTDESPSEYQGEIGERLDLNLTVVKAYEQDGDYGRNRYHYMTDEAGNQFLWKTTSKMWEVDECYHLRGTVKQHAKIRNVKTTILTRCTLVK